MKKCSNPDHPHCTLWVAPGDKTCASGHAQKAAAPTSFDLISARRRDRPAASGPALPFAPTTHPVPALQRPHLHVSGFDPRAAGGRQAIKVELRGMPANAAPLVTMQLQSALIAHGASRHAFVRTLRGDWRPVFIEFSSRDKEHGQYQIDVELNSQADGRPASRWACTMVILVPRADATLTEIHQTFLSTHKNVRVMADDASIARVNASTGGGRLDIDNFVEIVTEVERRLAHVEEPLHLSIMGCAVNGPGEAHDSQLGITFGRNVGMIFKDGVPMRRVSGEDIGTVRGIAPSIRHSSTLRITHTASFLPPGSRSFGRSTSA